MYYPPETRVSSLTKIKRERKLPVPGEVVVHVGQRVEPWDVVAQAARPGGYRILEIAQALKVQEGRIRQYLLKNEGDDVEAGESIAIRRGFFRRAVRSPVDGYIVAVGAGRVLIEADTDVIELRAGTRGRVAAVHPNRGATIETVGAVVQGVWGNGREGHGVLKTLADSPQSILTRESIEIGFQGAVVLAGQSMTLEALEFAQEMQVRGIIVGSLEFGLLETVNGAEFPIIATEGWGAIPMSPLIFDVLQANDGREVSLCGQVRSGWEQVYPEVIIPLLASETPPEEEIADRSLEKGAMVRILRQPHTGATGTVVALPAAPRKLAGGGTFRGVEVELEAHGRVFVPFANLELIR
jgi:hypothetical protein